MKKLYLASTYLVFTILISPISISYGAPFYINGIADCGTWYQARTKRISEILEASVQGYVNGAVMATQIEVWHGNGIETSPQSLYLYIDNYCQLNPLESIWSASWAFINEKSNYAFKKLNKLK
jgi:hypothetical protein